MNNSALKRIFHAFPIFASLVISLYRRQITLVHKDSDDDFQITSHGVHLFSASPFAWYDKPSQQLHEYSYVCKSGDNAIIVGVEDGLELLHFCRRCYPGLVIAVEPSPDCIRRLHKLKQANGIKNLTIVEAAAGNRIESSIGLSRACPGSNDLSNVLSDIQADSLASFHQVPMTTLESIISTCNLSSIDYIKINVEGAELLVLQGLGLFSHSICNICVSCHDFISPAFRTYDQVYSWLIRNSYHITHKPYSLTRPWDNYYLYATPAPPNNLI